MNLSRFAQQTLYFSSTSNPYHAEVKTECGMIDASVRPSVWWGYECLGLSKSSGPKLMGNKYSSVTTSTLGSFNSFPPSSLTVA